MNRLVAAFSFLLFSLSLSAATLRGTVTSAGEPLPGATVSIGQHSTVTDAAGAFALEVPEGAYTLRVVLHGFRVEERRVTAGDAIEVALTPALSESIVVSGIRADATTPITKTDIGRERIERDYHGQDIPLLLRDAPSINAWAESGTGSSGYSYITLRGLPSSRINFTLDGVPLADSEDMATYFVDFPDLARSLESIQIQRGVGTSTVGSPSFAGSINLESIAISHDAKLEADLGGGSYGNRQATIGYHTGDLSGFSLYSRYSFNESEGYRDNSGIRQRNLFVSAAKQLGDAQLKLTGFTAREHQQLSFYATNADTLRTNPRANPLTPEERDSFGYDLGQLQYIRALGNGADMTASAYYQRGYGWYRLYDYTTDTPSLREYGLDGVLVGSMLTYSRTSGALTTQYGLHLNRFKRDHTRDLLLDETTRGARDYANYGVKDEANAFAKVSWNRERVHLYGDAQLRYSDFEYHGDVDVDPISWTFFNPRVGARYDLSPRSGVYSSFGISTREPARNDLFLGEDNPSTAHDLHAVKPERVYDLEAGWDFRTGRVAVAANVYFMELRNEIASTGELSEIGLLLRRNVDRSYRRGIELDASWQATETIKLRTNANVSRNRIAEWTQFYDVYDEGGNWIDSRPVQFEDVEPLFTPGAIVNQAIEYTPSPRLSFGAVGRWTARSYLDNTNDPDFAASSSFVVDASASVGITSSLRVAVQVNNVFDADRVWPNGYSYLFFHRANGVDTPGGTAYYYPQATRNAVVLLQYRQ
ncbi:MAG TPA: TonB-dependent receptor [Thermoanaerobaculia bacterium]|jgi:iron complex outermembrane receptor protein